MWWIELGQQILSAVIVCALLAWPLLRWLVPKLVDQKLAERLETFRTERQKELEGVKALHQAELERLRQILSGVVQRQNQEHQVTFARQHKKRALVIEELHKKAYELELDGQNYTDNLGDEGNYEDIKQKAITLRSYATENEIYLSDDIMQAVFTFTQNVWEPVVQTGVHTALDRSKYGHKLIEAMDKNKGFRRTLVVEFRNILAGSK